MKPDGPLMLALFALLDWDADNFDWKGLFEKHWGSVDEAVSASRSMQMVLNVFHTTCHFTLTAGDKTAVGHFNHIPATRLDVFTRDGVKEGVEISEAVEMIAVALTGERCVKN